MGHFLNDSISNRAFLMDASLAPLKRRFERLNDTLHERLPFSTTKTTPSLSMVFEGSRNELGGHQKVVVEFEPIEEKSCTKTSDKLTEGLYDDVHESLAAYLVVCEVVSQTVGLTNPPRVRFVSIPDGIEELRVGCFYWRENLSRVTFGESSSLKSIGMAVFSGSGVVEIHVPDRIEQLLRDHTPGLPPLCGIMKLA